MHIVFKAVSDISCKLSNGDILHEMQILFSGKNMKNVNLLLAKFVQRVVNVNQSSQERTCLISKMFHFHPAR